MIAGLGEVSGPTKEKLKRGLQLAVPWEKFPLRPYAIRRTEIKCPNSPRRLRCSEGLLSTSDLHGFTDVIWIWITTYVITYSKSLYLNMFY